MKKLLFTFLLLLSATFTLSAAATPTFPGGEAALKAYLDQNLKYPPRAIENGIEGNVPLQFVVKADGSITSVKVTRMIDPDLEAEAIRLVKNMPAWIPADSGDATADLTIVFRLPDE